ncbi:spike base protein, RCAP_Rcc01079 family [Xanthobacter oligotrophicus]|uniref:spike base protein, RCAP_Rcc01079 family n=1 Tax=Xanthobacter oligotrophicus TaxID=2607286 RepID=UPI0011F20A0D|nr:hypothetical protein [Xanthobacter oligotrophicus]MCG5235968.1 hypothetical protein [Xanthobacter oligotrophicus]
MPYDPARDPLKGLASSLSSPARRLARITPADGADLATYAKALWVYVPEDVAGGVATIRITPVAGGDADTVDVLALPGLQPLPPCQVRRVWATGTSAGLAIYALTDR